MGRVRLLAAIGGLVAMAPLGTDSMALELVNKKNFNLPHPFPAPEYQEPEYQDYEQGVPPPAPGGSVFSFGVDNPTKIGSPTGGAGGAGKLARYNFNLPKLVPPPKPSAAIEPHELGHAQGLPHADEYGESGPHNPPEGGYGPDLPLKIVLPLPQDGGKDDRNTTARDERTRTP